MILIDKSASARVLRAVWELLDNNMIPSVYDHIPAGAILPYIQVQSVSETPFSSKTRYGSSVNLDITSYMEAEESKSVQEMSSDVIKLLKEGDLTVEGYSVVGIELVRNECAQSDVDDTYWSSLSVNVWVEETDDEPASGGESPGPADGPAGDPQEADGDDGGQEADDG